MTLDRTVAKYLKRSASSFSRQLEGEPFDGVDQVVVIPALAEGEHIAATLDCCQSQATEELERTAVIVVVNNRPAPLSSSHDIEDNRRTLEYLRGRIGAANLRLGVIDAARPGCELAAKDGVGEARRIGLDHGLRILLGNGAGRGRLISLDGDSRVDSNYLSAIRRHFAESPCRAAVVDYAHRLDGSPNEVEAIVAYELFLRYHAIGLAWARSPYSYPAIGSTMVCRADAYVAAGGMNRRQAAEDFYFLQQLQKIGDVARIRTTRVYPSCRSSHRVPFGTGATVSRLLRDGVASYRVYNAGAYGVVRTFIECAEQSLDESVETILERAEALFPGLASYVRGRGFQESWPRLQHNAANSDQLRAQFHRWFDAFQTLKMIHFLRDGGLGAQSLEQAFAEAVRLWQIEIPEIDWTSLDGRIALLNALRSR